MKNKKQKQFPKLIHTDTRKSGKKLDENFINSIRSLYDSYFGTEYKSYIDEDYFSLDLFNLLLTNQKKNEEVINFLSENENLVNYFKTLTKKVKFARGSETYHVGKLNEESSDYPLTNEKNPVITLKKDLESMLEIDVVKPPKVLSDFFSYGEKLLKRVDTSLKDYDFNVAMTANVHAKIFPGSVFPGIKRTYDFVYLDVMVNEDSKTRTYNDCYAESSKELNSIIEKLKRNAKDGMMDSWSKFVPKLNESGILDPVKFNKEIKKELFSNIGLIKSPYIVAYNAKLELDRNGGFWAGDIDFKYMHSNEINSTYIFIGDSEVNNVGKPLSIFRKNKKNIAFANQYKSELEGFTNAIEEIRVLLLLNHYKQTSI